MVVSICEVEDIDLGCVVCDYQVACAWTPVGLGYVLCPAC